MFCRTWRSIGCEAAGKEAVKCDVRVLLPDGWYDLLRAGNRDIKRYWDKARVFRYVKCEMENYGEKLGLGIYFEKWESM